MMNVSFCTQKFAVSVTGSKNLVAIYKFFNLTAGPIFRFILFDTVSSLCSFIKKVLFQKWLYVCLHGATRPMDPVQ